MNPLPFIPAFLILPVLFSCTQKSNLEIAFHTTFATIGAIAAASSFIFALVDKDKGITRKRKKAA